MKKIFLVLTLLLGVEVVANGQEWFITATRKGGPADGYITGGFMKKGWGFYAGLPYGEIKTPNGGISIPPGVNTNTGNLSDNMKFGVLPPPSEGGINPADLIAAASAMVNGDGTFKGAIDVPEEGWQTVGP